MKALLLENIHPDAVRLLDEAGLEVVQHRSALGKADLAAALPGVAVLGIRSKTRLSAALCDAVLDTTGSAAVLEMIERENLFLLPLDLSRRWYRYHQLFAELLRAELART